MTKQMPSNRTKPKCIKGTACGYSCISGKYSCSSKVLARDATALVASVDAKAVDFSDHNYVAGPLDGLSFKDAKAVQAKYLVESRGLSQKAAELGIEAVGEWTLSSKFIREADTGVLDPMLDRREADKHKQRAEDLNAMLDVLPKYSGSIMRGMNFADTEELDAFVQSIADGFELKGMSSFTSAFDVAKTFSRAKYAPEQGIVLNVKQNKSGVSIKPFTGFKMESEVVVQKAVKYKTVSVRKDFTGLTIVELEEV